MAPSKKLKAAYKEDLPRILEKLGVQKDFENGLVYCSQCGCTISYDSLGIIARKESNKIEFICNNPECIEENSIKK